MGTGWNALVLATILNICWFDCLLNLLFGSSSSSSRRRRRGCCCCCSIFVDRVLIIVASIVNANH